VIFSKSRVETEDFQEFKEFSRIVEGFLNEDFEENF